MPENVKRRTYKRKLGTQKVLGNRTLDILVDESPDAKYKAISTTTWSNILNQFIEENIKLIQHDQTNNTNMVMKDLSNIEEILIKDKKTFSKIIYSYGHKVGIDKIFDELHNSECYYHNKKISSLLSEVNAHVKRINSLESICNMTKNTMNTIKLIKELSEDNYTAATKILKLSSNNLNDAEKLMNNYNDQFLKFGQYKIAYDKKFNEKIVNNKHSTFTKLYLSCLSNEYQSFLRSNNIKEYNTGDIKTNIYWCIEDSLILRDYETLEVDIYKKQKNTTDVLYIGRISQLNGSVFCSQYNRINLAKDFEYLFNKANTIYMLNGKKITIKRQTYNKLNNLLHKSDMESAEELQKTTYNYKNNLLGFEKLFQRPVSGFYINKYNNSPQIITKFTNLAKPNLDYGYLLDHDLNLQNIKQNTIITKELNDYFTAKEDKKTNSINAEQVTNLSQMTKLSQYNKLVAVYEDLTNREYLQQNHNTPDIINNVGLLLEYQIMHKKLHLSTFNIYHKKNVYKQHSFVVIINDAAASYYIYKVINNQFILSSAPIELFRNDIKKVNTTTHLLNTCNAYNSYKLVCYHLLNINNYFVSTNTISAIEKLINQMIEAHIFGTPNDLKISVLFKYYFNCLKSDFPKLQKIIKDFWGVSENLTKQILNINANTIIDQVKYSVIAKKENKLINDVIIDNNNELKNYFVINYLNTFNICNLLWLRLYAYYRQKVQEANEYETQYKVTNYIK